MIILEDNIPIPPRKISETKYPWRLMAVGQSFLFDGKYPRSTVSQVNKRLAPKKFKTCLTDDKKHRIWRVE